MTQAPASAIEIVHLEHGNTISVQTLSARRERKGVWATVCFIVVGALVAGAMAVAVAHALQKIVYLPAFLLVWGGMVAGLLWYAVPRVRARLGRYDIGSRLENDAFAQIAEDVTLLRRRDDHFELTILPGMHGTIANGRMPIPVEALLEGKRSVVLLEEGAAAEVTLGAVQFAIRSRPEASRVDVPADWMRPFARTAVLALQSGLVLSLFCLGPSGRRIDERAGVHMDLKTATPWEAEKWLRIQAQHQAPSLYQCFESMPLTCQREGYVGIGVSLTRDGEIRSHWISRSTYDNRCPVEACMSDVIGTWSFDPLPQAMRVVLPVQVLRTDRPLALWPAMAPGRGGRLLDQRVPLGEHAALARSADGNSFFLE